MALPDFLEKNRFNTEIRYGTVGGPEFNTDVVIVGSGAEYRNANWVDSRGHWEIGQDLLDKVELDYLIGFFRQCRGRAVGFRFKDWADFEATFPTLLHPEIPVTGGFIQRGISGNQGLQMVRLYKVGDLYTYKVVTKPVEGTVTLHGVSGDINYATGVVSTYVPTAQSATTFDGTSFVTDIGWSGEFDIPARFDTDKIETAFEAYRDEDGERLFSVTGVTLVELNPGL